MSFYRGVFRKRFLPLLVAVALLWAGCGGSKKSTTTTVSITVSPTTANVAGGTTQQFTAMVTGSTNTAVKWAVNGEAGGDAVIGTISSTGLYTAPTKVTTNSTVTVTATSQADTTQVATAVVTLTAPSVTISIAPTSASVPAGGTVQFTPTVTSANNNTAVTWSVTGCSAAAICGSISSTGLYTAPAAPPRESITVVATSQANTAFTASAPITIQFSKASLNGRYVFLASQPDGASGGGFALRAGAFNADGVGNITGGVEDFNSAAGPSPAGGTAFAGTYTVGLDGRGTATINDPAGAHTFSFALTSSTRGQIIEFDSAGVSSGFIRQQDQTAIAALNGPYVFVLSGDNAGPFAAVGQLAFSNGNITGTEDANSGGVFTQQVGVVGSYTVSSGGRGTATITGSSGTSQFALYIIDASTIALVDLDSSGVRTAGTAYAQSTTSFTTASLLSSVYLVNGNAVPGNKPYAQAGRFDTSGSGSFSGGIFDTNNAGTVNANVPFASSASYTQTTNGRFQLATGTSNFVVWLASSKLGVILETDSSSAASGLLFQQQTGFQSVTGGYESVTSGASADGTTPEAVDAQFTTAGFGVLSGTQDVNAGGATPQSGALSGNFAVNANGRGTGSISLLTSGNPVQVGYAFYFVTPDRFLLMSTSTGSPVLSGAAERQCSDCSF